MNTMTSPGPDLADLRDPYLSDSEGIARYWDPHAVANAPRGRDALKRYNQRIGSPTWPDDADEDDYRLAARLSVLHSQGAAAYRQEWTAEDQALSDRAMSRRAAL